MCQGFARRGNEEVDSVRRDLELPPCPTEPTPKGTHCWPKLSWWHFCDDILK